MDAWCSLVNMSPCHGEDRGFESLRVRHKEDLHFGGLSLFRYIMGIRTRKGFRKTLVFLKVAEEKGILGENAVFP